MTENQRSCGKDRAEEEADDDSVASEGAEVGRVAPSGDIAGTAV